MIGGEENATDKEKEKRRRKETEEIETKSGGGQALVSVLCAGDRLRNSVEYCTINTRITKNTTLLVGKERI